MRNRIKGIVDSFSTAPGKIKLKASSILAPLTAREKLVYSVLALGFISLIIAPRIIADVGDEGSIFAVAATECQTTDAWLNAHLAAGQPSVSLSVALREEITNANAASWTGQPGDVACTSFSPREGHTFTNNAVSLTLKATNKGSMEESASESSAQPEAAVTKLQDGEVLNERIEQRGTIVEPNLYGDEPSAIDDIDGLLHLEISNDGGKTWQKLHSFGPSLKTEEDITFNIALPDRFIKRTQDFAIRVNAIQEDDSTAILLDSIVWTYEVGAQREIQASLINPSDETPRTEAKPLLGDPSELIFEVSMKDPSDGIWQGLRSQTSNAIGDLDSPLTAQVAILDTDGTIVTVQTLEGEFIDVDSSNRKTWLVDASVVPPSLQPGDYTIELQLDDGSGTTQAVSQDFAWGVLAMNLDKSSYRSGETGRIDISVLDEDGRTVCDAELQLTIVTPSGNVSLSTADKTIQISDTCDLYGNHIQADYLAEHRFNSIGDYSLRLDAITENGTRTIYRTATVNDAPSFEISRSGPTRVFPVLDYPMRLSVYSAEGYSGLITDFAPLDFKILPDNNARTYDAVSAAGNQQQITWDVTIAPGETLELGYLFDAPDIAPAFYTLGPAFIGEGETTFSEPRAWQIAGDAIGNMLLFYDGATIPTGWSCVSCTGGDAFYQRFMRGAATYGATGGATTHTHTASGTVAATGAAAVGRGLTGDASPNNHSHTFTPTIGTASNLPSYRQLKVIRYDTSGEPSSIPAGAIALFDATAPSGWTQYSAQNGFYVRGENTAGTTGGSNTHTHSISGTTSAASGGTNRIQTGGTQVGVATSTHDHTVSGTSNPSSTEPPYRAVILAQKDSAGAPPNDMIAMWDDEPAVGWNSVSGSGDAFDSRFIKAAATYGATGGASSHGHTSSVVASGGPNQTATTRSDTSAASDTHTHNVTVNGYSSDTQLPPYREVVIAKRAAVPTYEQSAYRFYNNDNSTDVGSALAAQDTAATAPEQLTPFRLRMLMHVTVDDMTTSYENFKLQYAEQSGSCDVSFSGETYSDVGTSSGALRYHDNSSASDGDALTTNANDPTHATDTIRAQDYEESNNFTNSEAQVSIGEDGLWDFSLVDFSADGNTTYCFRIVKSDGSQLNSYSVIPEITTAPPPPNMVLLFDGASIPTGWSCVSCSGGDEAYQRFIRGEATTSTGGNPTHTHTATGSVALSADTDGRPNTGSGLATADHTHSYTPNIVAANNLPAYRQLQVIKYDSGTPATIPAGAIGLFDVAPPAGFTRYSAQDGSYVRGENTIGTTGGSNTHTHTISGSTSASGGAEEAFDAAGSQEDVAVAGHTHAVSGTSDSIDFQPPFIEVYLGQANADTSIPGSFIAMWDSDPGGTWTCLSCTGADPFYQTFFKPANGYGTTGGNTTHTHADTNITSGAPSNITATRAQNNLAADTHTHTVSVTNFSTDNHLPPFIDYVFAQSAATNSAPNNPANLGQEKTDTTSLAVGAWTNETTVTFTADVSDPDNPDTLSLCVEVQPIGTAFTNSDTACGATVAYSGTAVAATVAVPGLTDGEEYHWQARTKDGLGVFSGWLSFGGNAESARDIGIDATAPTGTVYDGSTPSVDIDFNSGALDTLSANWVIDSSPSGLVSYEYSIGTSAGAVDVKGWTNNGTTDSITDSTLTLNTNQPYYFNVRTTDGADSTSVISSDGQFVAPTLNFSIDATSLDLGTLNAGNNYTSTGSTTLTTSTNAYNGYEIRAYATGLLVSGVNTIGMFDGGTYVSTDEWLAGDIGYGYTSSDTTIGGINKFNGSPCSGGGNPPCYAPWSITAPGDVIADHTTVVSGSPIVNEQFTITHRVTSDASQANGDYTTTIIYSITARY